MAKEASGGFLSKVVQLVRGPAAAWGDTAAPASGPLTDKQALKAAIERKRRNDLVRKREFDMLRAIRKREQQSGQDVVARPSFFQSSVPSESDGREQTIKKIDAIEAQMSTHWWQAVPGEDGPRASQRLQAPPSDLAPLDGAAHLQARAFDATGNTWSHTDSSPPTDLLTQPANEFQWPLPGQARAPQPLPVTFGDETTQSQTLSSSRPAPLQAHGLDIGRCLGVPGVEEAAVRFANGDDAGTEGHLGAALIASGDGPAASDVRRLLLDLFRATGRREAFELHAAEWSRALGEPMQIWAPLRGGPSAAPAEMMVKPVVWTCPPVLDATALAALSSAGAAEEVVLVMDWSALATADATAAQGLLAILEGWLNTSRSLAFVGSATLRRSLRASTPSGRRENHPVWWRLRLVVLQLLGRADEFDLAALDYCVTYGVTPPDWTAPLCQLRELDAVPAQVPVPADHIRHAAMTPSDALAAPIPAPTGALSGTLQGDVTTALNAIAMPSQGSGPVIVDCGEVTRTDFVAAGALLQWALALKDAGRSVQLRDVHGLLSVFFYIVGIADVAEVVPRPR